MIRKLRRKFISITAGALFAMILLVLAAVNGMFFFQTNRQLDRRLDSLLREQSGTPASEPPASSAAEPPHLPGTKSRKDRIRAAGTCPRTAPAALRTGCASAPTAV